MRPKLAAIKVSDCHLVPVICVGGLELAYLEQVEAEGLDLSQDAVQRGLVQEPGEHGVRAVVIIPATRRDCAMVIGLLRMPSRSGR